MAENQPYDLQLLWDATDGGLTYFQDELSSYLSTPKGMKGFAVRKNDDTGSCHIKKNSKGVYLFTDFGVASKGVNAVSYVMQTQNLEYLAACEFLFSKYGLSKNKGGFFKPEKTWDNDTKKPLEYWKVTPAKKHHNYKIVAPFLTDAICKEYNFVSVESFETVKKVTDQDKMSLLTVKATADYPIFAYKFSDFAKIYEPKATKNDKGFSTKHHFLGTKPERHIYGWDRIFDKVDLPEIKRLHQLLERADSFYEKQKIREELNTFKLDSVFIATGGSDGLNIASLGYNVIWFNSEAEIISSKELNELLQITKIIYYIPDLDKTGVRQAVKMGLMSKKHLEIKMVWLPEWLQNERKKDIADLIRKWAGLYSDISIVQSKFKQLLSQALEFKFWEWNDKSTYSINGKKLLNFLKHNGFGIYKIDSYSADNTTTVEETRLIHIKQNIVKVVSAREIRNYVLQWLEENYIEIKIYNLVLKSVFFSEKNSLLQLPEIDLDTRSGTVDSQLYFYKNKVVKVTPDKIVDYDYKDVDNLVWQKNIIEHDFKLQDKHFTIAKNETGNYTIDIHNNCSNYFKVLINTSRKFWKKDIDEAGNDTNKFKITSTNLEEEENLEQQIQLINKMFCIGHLAHKYKIKQKSFLVLGIDGQITKSAKDSKGGSGKSFTVETLYHFLKNTAVIDGRNIHKEDQKFILDGVTKETDLLYYEDLTPYYDFNSFFNFVTGPKKANHKGGKMYNIRYEDFAKVVVTMNAVPHDITESLRRRLIVFECCNYYHGVGEEFEKARTIADDFDNKALFDENYSEADWNNDINFVMQCLQFYLGCNEKIEGSQENLIDRNLIQKIGEEMMAFCNEFFIQNPADEDPEPVFDELIDKAVFYKRYIEIAGKNSKSSTKFKESLIDYCNISKNNFKIEFKKKRNNVGNSVEHFKVSKGKQTSSTSEEIEEPETDLPF